MSCAISSRRFPVFSALRTVVFLPILVVAASARASDCIPPALGLMTWFRAEGDAADYTGWVTPDTVRDVGYAAGKVGWAWVFRTNRAEVRFGAQGVYEAAGNVTGFTIEGWIRPDDTNRFQPFLWSFEPMADSGPGVYLAITETGALEANLGLRVKSGRFFHVEERRLSTEPGRIQPQQWTHFGLTWDPASRVLRLYVNGRLEAGTTVTIPGMPGYDTRVITYLGFSVSGDRYAGLLDELSIYERALAPEEIAAIHAAGEAGKCADGPAWGLLPRDSIVQAGRALTWTALAVGAAPIRYQWYREGQPLPGATDAILTVGPFPEPIVTWYQVVASNAFGSITSAPIQLDARWLIPQLGVYDPYVQQYFPVQPITQAEMVSAEPVAIFLECSLAGAQVFYTTNGRAPDFDAIPYNPAGSVPILIGRSAVLRAGVYSSELLAYWEMPPLRIRILPRVSLQAGTDGGGRVTVDPPGPLYAHGTEVTLRAEADPGWQFLHWSGDAAGTSPEVRLRMDRPRTVRAVFGTHIQVNLVGQGTVVIDPPLPPYPYGVPVRLTAVPAPGHRFSLWGGNLSGTANPARLVPDRADPSIIARFDPLNTNEVSLTVIVEGEGEVQRDPGGNVHPTGTRVTLRALPAPGATFEGWSGDTAGNNPTLVLTLDTQKTVRARFSRRPMLQAPTTESAPAGFRFEIVGTPGQPIVVESSGDLQSWELLTLITNALGRFTVLDTNATAVPGKFYRARLLP
ncbi:InlB B-repeat-containing protein [Limisphaera sp. 4302-co]|uniref:InlB B-repeat-containing protein n=1 Tax=Limisphaera sp. 4302-co TaxID=3400417 RepID=UPI003C215A1C